MPESESVSIGVIMERRPLDSPWQDHEWRVAGLVTGAPGGAEGEPLSDAAGLVRYYAGAGALSLHTTEVSGYIENLTSPQASLYVVLRRGEAKDGGLPWVVERVTANPYEAQDYLPSDDVLVEKVAMPEAPRLWVEAFVAAHYREEPFRKRRRDKVVIEEHKFGHEPIVELRRRRRAAGEDEG
jgi:hypothetical protein